MKRLASVCVALSLAACFHADAGFALDAAARGGRAAGCCPSADTTAAPAATKTRQTIR